MSLEIWLDDEIALLRRAEKQACRRRYGRKAGYYRYLAGVFDCHQGLLARNELIAARDLLQRKLERRCKSSDPVRVLIDATSRADAKTKSKWTRAVHYLIEQAPGWERGVDARGFLKSSGGIAGSACKIAAKRPRKRRPKHEGRRDWI